jgi:hypothetical protein
VRSLSHPPPLSISVSLSLPNSLCICVCVSLSHHRSTSLGQEIIENAPQIICSGDALDSHGNPTALETYNFSPTQLMQHVSLDSYKSFVVYCLQYKSLIIEQLSEAKEREYLAEHNGNPPETENGYGIILQCTIIRCLKGMSMEFLGPAANSPFPLLSQLPPSSLPPSLC